MMNFDLIYARYLLEIDELNILDETRNAFVSAVNDVDSATEASGKYHSSVFYAIVDKAKRMTDSGVWNEETAESFVMEECGKNGVIEYFGGEDAFRIAMELELRRDIPSDSMLEYAKEVFARIQYATFADAAIKREALRQLLRMLLANNLLLEDKDFSRTLMEANRTYAEEK